MKWQPIEKLPPKETPLIILLRGVVQFVTYEFVIDEFVCDPDQYRCGFIPFHFGGDEFYIPRSCISHWMPLPEPPEVDNNGQHEVIK